MCRYIILYPNNLLLSAFIPKLFSDRSNSKYNNNISNYLHLIINL